MGVRLGATLQDWGAPHPLMAWTIQMLMCKLISSHVLRSCAMLCVSLEVHLWWIYVRSLTP